MLLCFWERKIIKQFILQLQSVKLLHFRTVNSKTFKNCKQFKGASTNQKKIFNVQWTLRGGGGLGVDVKIKFF